MERQLRAIVFIYVDAFTGMAARLHTDPAQRRAGRAAPCDKGNQGAGTAGSAEKKGDDTGPGARMKKWPEQKAHQAIYPAYLRARWHKFQDGSGARAGAVSFMQAAEERQPCFRLVSVISQIRGARDGTLAKTKSDSVPVPGAIYWLDTGIFGVGRNSFAALTARASLRNAERYSQINDEGVRLRFRMHDGSAVIALDHVNVDRHTDRHQIEFWLVTLVRICRQVTNGRSSPLELKTKHFRNRMPVEIRTFFGVDIEFGANADEIWFPGYLQDKTLPISEITWLLGYRIAR
jgi:Arabinose-binding domain of AraC transcription regulator, N-term